jgi:DivIVA domain-containing protein
MTWLVLVLAVVLVGLTVAAVLGRIDGSLAEPTTSLSYLPLPEGSLTHADLEAIRLDTGLRGYRMDQVDEVIGRLAQEIDGLQARLAATSEGSPSGVDAGVVEAPEHLP